jgi:transposase
MLQVTPHMRVLVAIEPVDFRRGIDGLARVCREELRTDPFSGWVFVFRNRSATAIKVLVYDSQGFWLAQKRLSTGRFRWWPAPGVGGVQGLEAHEFQVLLACGNPEKAAGAPPWRRVRSEP